MKDELFPGLTEVLRSIAKAQHDESKDDKKSEQVDGDGSDS